MENRDVTDNVTTMLGTRIYRRVWEQTGILDRLSDFFEEIEQPLLTDAVFDAVAARSLAPQDSFTQWRTNNSLFYQTSFIKQAHRLQALILLGREKSRVFQDLRECMVSRTNRAHWMRVHWNLFGLDHCLKGPFNVHHEDYWSMMNFEIAVIFDRNGFPLAYDLIAPETKSSKVTKQINGILKGCGYTVTALPSESEVFWKDEEESFAGFEVFDYRQSFELPRERESDRIAWTDEYLQARLMLCHLSLWTDVALVRILADKGVELSVDLLKTSLNKARLVCIEPNKASDSLYAKIDCQGDFETIARAFDLSPLPRLGTRDQVESALKL